MKFALPLLLLLLQDKLDLKERWIYYSVNLWVDKNLDTLEAVLRRAAKVGYNGVLLADSKFGKLGDMDARYFKNIDRVKKLAEELKLRIIPAIFPIGYSESILWHDPNLAEALPVRDAPFVVKGGVAMIQSDVALREKWDWKDEAVSIEDGALHVADPKGKNARAVQKIKVHPFRQYHVSVRIKSKDFRGTPEIKVLAGQRALNYAHLGVKATQDWTEHHAVFNSLDNEEVGIYLGVWDGRTGELWWKDARLEETGLLNIVRRDGAPLVIQGYVEGKDFEKVIDPKMGTVPWKGGYEVWHEPPALKTSLPDGAKLQVSYYHAVTIHDHQVAICLSEPKTVELLRDQAKRMHAAWGARGYFMSHDEIRVLGWDDACARRKLDAGAILADNVKTCIKILREVNPKGDIYVWSDMFDPHHNAHKDYYLVRGDLSGSWEGLDKDVIIADWYLDKRNESLKFFADRGHRQIIAGYYDAKPEGAREWLDAAKKVKGVVGIMYTTWENRYSDLERFSEVVNEYR